MDRSQEQPALQQELENRETTAQRRQQIGERLARIGDPRAGVGVSDGVPDIVWLPVTPGGEVTITRVWHPDSPEEEAKVIYFGNFTVEPFAIAKYLVTYAQYQAFVDSADGFDNLDWWQGMSAAHQRQPLADQRTKLSNHPRDGISWYQSIALARWVNHRLQGFEIPHPSGQGVLRVGNNAQIRLPTEQEWQWAAQAGAQARTYPWCETQSGYANTSESGLYQSIAVGMYPHGAAACSALDMSGNLMEWCTNNKSELETIDVASAASKVLRGGDWGYSLDQANCAYCDDDDPARIDRLNGCRLVLGKPYEGIA